MVRHRQIHRGDADGAADALAVLHRLAQAVAVAQKFLRPLHVTALHQRPDIGGADGDALQRHLGDDVAAYAQLSAFLLQKLHVAGVLVSEPVVVARHQVHRAAALYQQPGQEILPGHSHHLPVEGGENDLLNAVQPLHQALPVPVGVDEIYGLSRDHLLGRPVEGKGRRHSAQLGGTLRRFAQQRPVAPVYAVKKAQGDDSFFQIVHAPKKFFSEVSTPLRQRLRHRNAPSGPYTRYSPSVSSGAGRGLPHRQRLWSRSPAM